MSVLRQLFQRYGKKNSSTRENRWVDAWYDSYEGEDVAELTTAEEEAVRSSLWNKLSATLEPRNAAVIWLKRGMAAAIIGLIAAGSWLIATHHKKPAPEYAEIVTRAMQRKNLHLPDGSELLLNPGSSVKFAKNFDEPLREIFMPEGEVYYNIAPDQARPFIIHSNRLTIRVLGTAFNVRTIRGISEQEVLVTTGKVQVQKEDNVLGVLTAGDELRYDATNDHYTISDHKDLYGEQLQQGWMVLDNVSFTTTRALIQKRYDATIVDSHNKLTHAFFTASFRPDASLQDVMQVLCGIQNVGFAIKAKEVRIY